MSDYLQDLVQNIYTKCDMSGFDDYKKAVNDLTKNAKQSARDRIRLVEQEEKAKIRLADYEDKYARKKKQRDLDEISRMTKRNGLIKAGMRLIGAYLSIRTLQNIIHTGSQLQLLQRSIEGLTGSGQDWQFINEQAYKFGVSLETVAKGYKNFFSSARMAGFSTNQIQGMFSDILLGARSIGASTQQIEGALLALEQMMSKGRVSMEELRRQLGNALPGAFEIGAKAMGVTTMQFNEMVKAGISAQEFVPKFITTFKEQYANGWKDVEQTVAVAQGRLKVAWEQFTVEFLHGESGKALAEGITALADMLRTQEFKDFVRILSKVFSWVSKIFTVIVKNHRAVLLFLGAAGVMGLLQQNTLLLRILNKEFLRSIQLLLAFGKAGRLGFSGIGVGIKMLTSAFLKFLMPLMLIEDIILGLGQFFLGWDVRSLTGDMLMSMKGLNDVKKDPYGTENVVLPESFVNNLRTSPHFRKVYDKALKSGNSNAMYSMMTQNYSPKPEDIKRGIISPNAPMYETPYIIPNTNFKSDASGLILEKNENNENHIAMGDLHFHINGAGDPYVAANIFKDIAMDLLTGQLEGGVVNT